MPEARLDLDQPRGFADLLKEAGRLFRRHLLLFPGLTLLLTIVPSVVLDGVWGEMLQGGSSAPFRWEPVAIWWFLVAPLVVAVHVRIVQRMGEGLAPAPWQALRETARLAPVVVAAFALASVALALGLALLVIPGVYVGTLLALSVDAAVVERVGPVEALRVSARIVRGQWARGFGYLTGGILVLGVVPWIPAALVGFGIEEAFGVPVYFAFFTVVSTLLLSLGCLFEALVYFDLRHRRKTEV